MNRIVRYIDIVTGVLALMGGVVLLNVASQGGQWGWLYGWPRKPSERCSSQ